MQNDRGICDENFSSGSIGKMSGMLKYWLELVEVQEVGWDKAVIHPADDHTFF
jgi:hypothetical protein